MRTILISAAAIALAATGAVADPGGKGGGSGGKAGGPDHAAMGHGGGKPDRGPGSVSGKEGGPGEPKGGERATRGPGTRAEPRADARAGAEIPGNNDRGAERGAERADRKDGPAAERPVGRANERKAARAAERPIESARREARVVRAGRDESRFRDAQGRIVRSDWFTDARFGLIDGCPPGLAGKGNGCIPPGLAKQRDRDWDAAYYRPDWWGYERLGDGRYLYDDGYLYRLGSNNRILGYVPLLGGALAVGNPWPGAYEPYPVPEYYREYYDLGPAGSYRYADDVLYRVNPASGVIESIAALLTGDRFVVGQPLPAGYDVYNVPYGYQDRYYDTDEAYYRYADGYVYEVDPATQLVTAVIELLV